MNKTGRPKTGKKPRAAEVSCSLTPDDAEGLAKFAGNLGFRSRSEFLTAILERLMLGGFAPIAFFKLGWQLKALADKAGASKGAGFFNPFESWPPFELEALPHPEPTLPEEDLAPAETKKLLAYTRKELQIR